MSSRASKIVVAAALALATTLSLAVAPAGASGAGLAIVSVDTSAYPDIRFVVEVPEHLSDREIAADAWRLVEANDARKVTVRSVVNEALRVVLVIDTSGSMQGHSMDAAKAAAAGFVDRVPAGSEVGVVGFGSRPTVLHALSADRSGAHAAIAGLQAAGETALYDAVMVAAQQAPADGRRTEIILLSDGGDTRSAASIERAGEVLRGSAARLHAIALESAEANRGALESLAGVTSGTVVAASDPAALASVYERLAARLVERYEVAYASAAHGSTSLTLTAITSAGELRGDTTIELPAATLAPPPLRTTTVAPSSIAPLLMGGVLVFVGLAILLTILFLPASPRALLAGAARRVTKRGRLADISDRATLFAQAALDSGKAKGLAVALENAGIMLRPAEFVVVIASVTFGAAVIGFVLGGFLFGALTGAFVLLGSRVFVTNRITKRRAKFGNQLGDTLQQLTSALRAGNGLLQALAVVAREADAPTSEEFRRLMTEVRLGRDLTDALHAMAARVGSDDFNWVVQAVEVQRDVGGDLVEVLEIVAATIRQRHHLQRQVKALSAEGRFSAYVLLALPFGVGLLMMFTNRAYLMKLFHGPGLALLIMGGILMVAGTAWLKKIIRLEY